MEIIKRNELHKFKVLPKRWVVDKVHDLILKDNLAGTDYKKIKINCEMKVSISIKSKFSYLKKPLESGF